MIMSRKFSVESRSSGHLPNSLTSCLYSLKPIDHGNTGAHLVAYNRISHSMYRVTHISSIYLLIAPVDSSRLRKQTQTMEKTQEIPSVDA